MMGFFAFYIGWIYNDFLSLTFNIFGSCYEVENSKWEKIDEDCTYPFGIDPAWRVSDNELAFMNSFKMKVFINIKLACCNYWSYSYVIWNNIKRS